MKIHKDLTPERWFKILPFEQLANVGMDVERTIQWRNKILSTVLKHLKEHLN